MAKLLIAKLIKKNGQIVFKNEKDLSLFQLYASQLREGCVIEQYTNFEADDGSLNQLAKIHAMISDIANETGETKSKIKKQVKRDCDLIEMNGELKSFGSCSKEELGDVIQHLTDLGDFLSIKFSNNA